MMQVRKLIRRTLQVGCLLPVAWGVLPVPEAQAFLNLNCPVTTIEEGNFEYAYIESDHNYYEWHVNYRTQDGTANSQDYYEHKSTSTSKKAYSNPNNIRLMLYPFEDSVVEDDETYTLTFWRDESKDNYLYNDGAKDNCVITIANDDTAHVSMTVTEVQEGETMTFEVKVNKAVQGGFKVRPTYTNGTAGSSDYTQNTATLTFAGNAGEKHTFTVPTREDAVVEPKEAFTVGLEFVGEQELSIVLPDDSSISIHDDDFAKVTLDDVSVTEGGTLTFTATLDRATKSGFKLDVNAANLTSSANDFSLSSTTLTFAGTAGETKTFTVTSNQDNFDETNETFRISLIRRGSLLSGINIKDTAIGTIIDDDHALEFGNVTVVEGQNAQISITLGKAVPGGFTVTPVYTNANASDNDYTKNLGTLTFAGTAREKKVLVVQTKGDADVEFDETVSIDFTVAGTTKNIIKSRPSILTIKNNDFATLKINDQTVEEGGTMTFEVTIDKALPVGAVITPSYRNATTGNDDYTSNTASLNFTGTRLEKRLFTVVTNDDDLGGEGHEQFTIRLTISGNSKDLIVQEKGFTTGTITDNDDSDPALTIQDASVEEGGDLRFTVSMNNVLLQPDCGGAYVYLSYTNGTADADDYTRTYTINDTSVRYFQGNANESKVFDVPTSEDSNRETDETFTVRLEVEEGSQTCSTPIVNTDSATGTIVNDDFETVSLAVSPSSISEDGGVATVTATLDKASPAATTVTVAVTPNSPAVTGDTSLSLSKVLTIAASETSSTGTVQITAVDNDIDAADKSFSVSGTAANTLKVLGPEDVTLTVTDDDVSGVTVSNSTLEPTEGSSATYSIVLDSEPSAVVSIGISKTGDSDLTVNPTAIAFSTSNWNTAQSVAVSAGEDADAIEGTGSISHSLSSEDAKYQALTVAGLTLTEDENDEADILLSVARLSALENASGSNTKTTTYTVRLEARPTGANSVTVTISKASGGDSDLTFSPSSLTFASSGATKIYSAAQTVTVTAASDLDGEEGTASLVHTASGGDYATAKATLSVAEDEADVKGLTLSTSNLSVPEGSTASYTLRLATRPTAKVTVTLKKPQILNPDTGLLEDNNDSDISISTDTAQSKTYAATGNLTFTTSNWSTVQTVWVTAAEDGDDIDSVAIFVHTAKAGGYEGLDAAIVATEDDNDIKAITAPASLSVSEGGSATYELALSVLPPAGSVTVTIAKTGDSDITGPATTAFTFTTGNWSTAHTLTVTVAQDDDGEAGTATLLHTASGEGYSGITRTLVVTESEDDTKAIVLSPADLLVSEGQSATYTVKLQTKPTGQVILSISKTGDANLEFDTDPDSVGNQTANLTFTTTNWSTAQTVAVSASQDNDALAGTAVLTHNATGGGYGSVAGTLTATEVDDEVPKILLSGTSLSISEGDSASYGVAFQTTPDANNPVTVSVAVTGTNATATIDTDPDTAENQDTLTFSAANHSTYVSVTVSLSEDADGEDGVLTLTHSETTTGLARAIASAETLTVSENDNDTKALTLSTANLILSEPQAGGAVNIAFDLQLATRPTGDVTVSLAKGSEDDADITIDTDSGTSGLQTVVTFTTDSYATTLTVTGVADNDAVDGRASFSFTATGGGYDDVAAATLVLVEADDDTNSLVLSPSGPKTLAEGSTDSFKLDLAAEPTGPVTVTVDRGDTDDKDLAISKSLFVFTTSNYSVEQTFTLTAREDLDGVNGSATLTFRAFGGGYGGVLASLSATENDNDTRGAVISPTELTAVEGSSATYTVKLSAQPSSPVNIGLSVIDATNADISVSPASLTFTAENFSDPQTVAVTAAEDIRPVAGSAKIAHSISGGGGFETPATVTVSEIDNDQARILAAPEKLRVTEGESATFRLSLSAQPGGIIRLNMNDNFLNESVNYAHDYINPDNGVVRQTGKTVQFAGHHYATIITVSAPKDADGEGTKGSIAVSQQWVEDDFVDPQFTAGTAVEFDIIDIDTKAVLLSAERISVTEGGGSATYTVKLATKPLASVAVGISGAGSGMTLSASNLTFTADNYSTAQTVTVSATDDATILQDDITLVHIASDAVSGTSSGYAGLSAGLIAAKIENDIGIDSTVAALQVSEGGSESYGIKLAALPSEEVTISVAAQGTPDPDFSIDNTILTFTTENWSTWQSVTISAARDADGDVGRMTVTHSPSGGGLTTSLKFTVVEIESDRKAVTLVPDSLTVTEKQRNSYKFALATRPSAAVTVTVTATTAIPYVSDGDLELIDTDSSLPLIQNRLTFNTGNYSVAQTLTVTALEDVDDVDGQAWFVHSLSGGGYDGITKTLLAIEDDQVAQGLKFTVSDLSLSESGSATYGVSLLAAPEAGSTVTVTVKRASGDASVMIKDTDSLNAGIQNTLVYTSQNYATAQMVTITAVADADGADGTAVLDHSSSGSLYQNVDASTLNVAVSDDDSYGIALLPDSVTVSETGSATYRIALSTQPTARVTVELSRSGDADIAVDTDPGTGGNQNSLTFTRNNFSIAQTVKVMARNDEDAAHGTAAISHTARNGGYAAVAASLQVTERDDDAGFAFTSTEPRVTEGSSAAYGIRLNAEPSADVTVSIAATGLDVDTDSATQGLQDSLVFTRHDYFIYRSVTLSAASDADGDNEAVSLAHTVSGASEYGALAATLTATIEDDDAKGFGLSAGPYSVAEGNTVTYGIRLATQPSGSVTVTAAPVDGTRLAVGDTNAEVPGNQNVLTFGTGNYATLQTLTLSALEDPDGQQDNNVAVAHTATGGGYDAVSERMLWTINDNDLVKTILLDPTEVTVTENGTATYRVRPSTDISSPVTVSVSLPENDDLAIVGASVLTFGTDDFSVWQTVTLSANSDLDADNPSDKILSHQAAQTGNGDYNGKSADLTAKISDSDIRAILVSQNGTSVGSEGSITVTEGSSARFTVRPSTKPSANVTIQYSPVAGGDDSITITDTDPSEPNIQQGLNFTPSNYSIAQTFTVTAAVDEDSDNGSRTFNLLALGGGLYDANLPTGVSRSLTVSEADSNPRAIGFSSNAVTVTEGATYSYSVRLTTKPTDSVKVTVRRTESGVQDNDIAVAVSSPPLVLTFTTETWNRVQSVTLTAGEDDDAIAGTAAISHIASGGDYGARSVSASLIATESDNDLPGLKLSATTITVSEGEQATYTVRLATRPGAQVTVTAQRQQSGTQDTDLVVVGTNDQQILTFGTANWSTPQTVTLTASADDDTSDGTAAIAHSASGGDYGSVAASLSATEFDSGKRLRLTRAMVEVSEGRSQSYGLRLNTAPTGDVVIAITRSGDGDLAATPASLTFTVANYGTLQTVTISAEQDGDSADGTASFSHTATGGGYDGIVATAAAIEIDDDARSYTLSGTRLTVAEGSSVAYSILPNTRPTGNLTVTISASESDPLTVQTDSARPGKQDRLTFTTGNFLTPQTVTVHVAEDLDDADEELSVSHSVTGYGGATPGDVSIIVRDNDEAGFQFATNVSALNLTVNEDQQVTEGATSTFGVRLRTLPTATVTATVNISDSGKVSVSPLNLTFTTANWSTLQTATLTGKQDNDPDPASLTLTYTATGGNYGDVDWTASDDNVISVRVNDDDSSNEIVLTPASLTVSEPGLARYGVNLRAPPTSPITVTIEPVAGSDASIELLDTDVDASGVQNTLTFTSDNFSTAQTATLTAFADDDAADGVARFTHKSTDYQTSTLTITEDDKDTRPPSQTGHIRVNVYDRFTLAEGAQGESHPVRLTAKPTGPLTVSITRTGDSDIVFQPSALTFSTTNYSVNQQVTVAAQEDNDNTAGTATLTYTPMGATEGFENAAVKVTFTESDNDRGLNLSVPRFSDFTVTEGSTHSYAVRLNTRADRRCDRMDASYQICG